MIESEKIMREFLLKRRSDIGNIENHIFFFERIQEVNARQIVFIIRESHM